MASEGWTMTIDHLGSDGGEVTFRNGGSESKVHAVCRNGEPTTESDGSHD
jgi:hypothetical protein